VEGVPVLVATAVAEPQGENMGIGLGIVFVVIGLILVLGVVQFDISFVDDVALGWILLIVGILAIILALVMNNQRSRTKHVEERRYDGPPPR
jgi:cell division protein FtsW (lipid II flippase)